MKKTAFRPLLRFLRKVFGRKKGFKVFHSFDPRFVDLIDELYTAYGEDVFNIQGIANSYMDVVKFRYNFFNNSACIADKTVDPNANNFDKSVLQYNYSNNKSLMRLDSLFMLWDKVRQIYDIQSANECVERLINGSIFCNDLHNVLSAYCYAFDLTHLCVEGMGFFKGNFKIKKPKRSSSFLALVIQATSFISNQITGAASYPNFFLLLDYFYRKEFGEDYMARLKDDESLRAYIHNQFQNFIYSMNFPFRGSESSFTNLSVLDKGFVDYLFKDYVYPDMTYLTEEKKISSIELSKIFFEYYDSINMVEGVFTFPVMTLAMSVDKTGKLLHPEFKDWIVKANRKKSLANIFINEPTSFSSCCRLVNNFEKLSKEYQNSFGVGGVGIGSHRIVGLNLYRNVNQEEFKKSLDCVHKLLRSHRVIIADGVKNGFQPLYSAGWIDLKRQYSTIGFLGAYEYAMAKGFDLRKNSERKAGLKELTDLLQSIEDEISMWEQNEREEFSKYNIEQIPAESMAVRLADVDRVLGYNTEYDLYSNQYIPLIEKVSIDARLEAQGIVDSKTSGGAIAHINVKDSTEISERSYKELINKMLKYKANYVGINYAFNECSNGHFSHSNKASCPICKKPIINTYTRVVGFLTPVKNWNRVRRQKDFPNREFYNNEFK